MLSNTSRLLTNLNAILYALLGASLFCMPEQLAPVFAWKVTPFVTIFVGGWGLGIAWLAFHVARRWEWRLVYTSLIFLWAFGISELAVVIAFRANLNLAHPIAWLYLTAISINTLAALVGMLDWIRIRPAAPAGEQITTIIIRGPLYAFILFELYIAYYGLTAQIGDFATHGEIFPESISLFTLRSFGALFISIALSILPFVRERGRDTLLSHGYLSFGLIVAITIAIFLDFRVFDLANNPFQYLFIGAYLVVGIVVVVTFAKFGTGFRKG